jgi:RHS repeat-associated protein
VRYIKYLLLLFALISSLSASIPSQITCSNNHKPLIIEYANGEIEEFTYDYDTMGRLQSRTAPNGDTITYSYDGVGNITQIETPTQTITKTYDALNRLKTVADAQGTVTYDYDAIGRQTKVTFANGVTTEYGYGSRNRITSIIHKNSSGDVLQSFSYTLDAVGNRTQIVEHSGRTVDYEYNAVNQLTKETVTNDPNGNNTTTTFTYNEVGNLKTKTINGTATDYTYNANDQLTTQGSKTFIYDSNGNLVSDDTNTYEHDDKNRLIKVTTSDDITEYSYDANDNRIAKTTSSGTTTYLIDANTPYAQVITESKEDGTEIHYTYGNDLLSDGSHSFLTDALGSTRGLVDSAETLTDSYAYTPYGELASHEGASENSFLFTGEQLDAETQDYYLRARYYSPNSGRFMSRDTYDGRDAEPATLNHYGYTHGNPVNYTDPSGHMRMVSLTMNMSVMSELETINIVAANTFRKLVQEAGCIVVEEGIDYAIKEGIYMWITHDGRVYVGKSNDDIEKRIKSHVQKKGKIFNKQLARIGLSLPPQLLETIEEVIMEAMGFESKNNPGNSANNRHNHSPKKPKRRKAYERYKRLLYKLCK